MLKFVFACLEHRLSTQLPEIVCEMSEALLRAAARNHLLSIGISYQRDAFMIGHFIRPLLFQSVFPYPKDYILFILELTWQNLLPSKTKWGNQYIMSLLPTAMTIQYLMGLKLCGIDCSGQDSGHLGQPVLLLKLSICSTKKETITQTKV